MIDLVVNLHDIKLNEDRMNFYHDYIFTIINVCFWRDLSLDCSLLGVPLRVTARNKWGSVALPSRR